MSGEILLVDWRAEAARPFCTATMASPIGLRRRRHLRVEDTQIAEISVEVFSGEALTAEGVHLVPLRNVENLSDSWLAFSLSSISVPWLINHRVTPSALLAGFERRSEGVAVLGGSEPM